MGGGHYLLFWPVCHRRERAYGAKKKVRAELRERVKTYATQCSKDYSSSFSPSISHVSALTHACIHASLSFVLPSPFHNRAGRCSNSEASLWKEEQSTVQQRKRREERAIRGGRFPERAEGRGTNYLPIFARHARGGKHCLQS